MPCGCRKREDTNDPGWLLHVELYIPNTEQGLLNSRTLLNRYPDLFLRIGIVISVFFPQDFEVRPVIKHIARVGKPGSINVLKYGIIGVEAFVIKHSIKSSWENKGL